jgi:hypothetical protein
VAYDFLECAETVENVFKKVITGDETWICGCDPETKQQFIALGIPFLTVTKKITSSM